MYFSSLRYLDTHLATVAHHLGKEQLFVVGGAVRDIILGINKTPHDIDMTLASSPDTLFKNLQKASTDDYSLFRTEKFGTVTLIQKSDNTNYEFTPFREESGYADNRHPDEIMRSDSLVADAKRRDFTINCLYYTVVGKGDAKIKSSLIILQDHTLIEKFFAKGFFQEEAFDLWAKENDHKREKITRFLIDPFKGLGDLENGVLRCVGNPEARFQEDALRILRGVRLVNTINQKLQKWNFDFEKETRNAMKKLNALVPWLAKERLHQEIVKVFSGKNPFGWVALIDELGLLSTLFPALHYNKHDDQPIRYHPFDTYTHILLTLRNLQQINDDYLVKLAMLYHDVGKKDQYAGYAKATTKEEMQAVHSSPLNHVISGPMFVEKDFSALWFSNKEIEEVSFYVANHMRPGQFLIARDGNQIKRMRQLLSENGYERTKNLLDITVADRRGQFNPLQTGQIDEVNVLYEILDKLYKEEWQFTMRDMAINGDDLMREFQIQPGPQIKQLLHKAFEWVLSDIANRNTQEAIITYLRLDLSSSQS